MTEHTHLPDFEPATRGVRKVVAGVQDDQLAGPTPCASWTVGDLLDHLMGLTVAFRLAAAKQPQPVATEPSKANLDPEWRRRLPAQLDELVAAWRVPSAWTGETEAGGVVLPADVMGLVALNEVVVHGWDLAAATGQPYEVDEATAEAVHSLVVQQASPDGTPGLFGPSVPAPADAPVFARVLGLAGRDPDWTSGQRA